MKSLFLLLILVAPLFLSAQDKLVKTDGQIIECKVIEIGPELISYKKWTNLNGPTYSLRTAEVNSIVFENGEIELLKRTNDSRPGHSNKSGIVPNEGWKHPHNLLSFNVLLIGFNQVSFAYEVRGEIFGFRMPFYYDFDSELYAMGISPKVYLNRQHLMQMFISPELFFGYSTLYNSSVLGLVVGAGLSVNPFKHLNFTIGFAGGRIENTGGIIDESIIGVVLLPEASFGLNF